MIDRPFLHALALVAFSTAAFGGALPNYDHIVVVVEENRPASAIYGNRVEAPYLNQLKDRGAWLTRMSAITHPSQPNYFHLFSGRGQGVTTNDKPTNLPFTTPNLGAALLAAGKTFVGYSQSLPRAGDAQTDGTWRYVYYPWGWIGWQVYARKHVPWTNWQSRPPRPANTLPGAVNQPFSAFPVDPAQLPDVAFVMPDQDHDMHNIDGSEVRRADNFLRKQLGAYADWAETHNSLLIVTWDEDDSSEMNRIPTIFVGAHVRKGRNRGVWTLHHLLRTLTDLEGLAPIGKAADVTRITGIFENDP